MGTLTNQIQQLNVDFSIDAASGTIDQVNWDFGNGTSTTTASLTTSYAYAGSGTYTIKATLTNSCGNETVIQQNISVTGADSPTVTLDPPADLLSTSVTLRITLKSTGNSAITRYGVCYSTTNAQPTEDDGFVNAKSEPLAINTPVSFSITNLSPNTLYYVRSFARNTSGKATGYSSPVQQFRTGQSPSVAVNGMASISNLSAAVNFVVTNPGSPAAIEYGICYSSSASNPDLTNSMKTTVSSPAIGVPIVVNLTNLTANTTYYYRPYARPAVGEPYYGPVMSFTTLIDVVAQDLIASVSFTDQSLLDISGFNNHVSLVGSPIFIMDRKGNANSAIQLNGSGDYFYMKDNSSLNPDALSISVWVKFSQVSDRMLIYNKSKFSDGTAEMYSSLIKPNPSGPGITINTDIKQDSQCKPAEGWQTATFSSSPDLSRWHHIVFTYSGKTIRMYFNNSQLGQKDDLPLTTIDKCPGGELKFGAQSQLLPQYFKGAIDDIKIFKRVLTVQEINALYTQ